MSNTDHPRSFGTHRAQHDDRENRKEHGHGGRRLGVPVKPSLDARRAIAEGLADFEATTEGCLGGCCEVEIADIDDVEPVTVIDVEPRIPAKLRGFSFPPRQMPDDRRIAATIDLEERFERRAAVIAVVGLNRRRRAAKRPISRLTDGIVHPVTVRTLSGVR